MTRKLIVFASDKQSVAILEPLAGPCPNLCHERNFMQLVLDKPWAAQTFR